MNRTMISVPRHVGGVAVEGIPRNETGIEIGEEGGGGGASEQTQGKKPREAEGALLGRFHDDLVYRTGCVVVKDGFSVPRGH